MKKLLLISLFAGQFTLATTDLVITKPYKVNAYDNINLKYPFLSNLVKSACIGAAAYFIGKHTEKINPKYLGMLASISTYVYNVNKKTNITKALLANPSLVINHNHNIQEKFDNEINRKLPTILLGNKRIKKPGSNIDSQEYKNLIQTYKNQSPIFLLGECETESFDYCVLSRTHQSKNRDCFETEVVNALTDSFKKVTISEYVSFGTGGMFQDLTILTKALAKKPDAQINIHCIDIQYYPYITYLNFLGNPCAMNISFDETNIEVLKQLIDDAKKCGLSYLNDEEIEKQIKVACLNLEERFQQMINYLKKTFPTAHLSFYIHDSTDNYLNYITQHNLQCPDVISAADIQDEMSILKGSLDDYIKLCIKTMQQKQNINILLAKDPIQGIGQIKKLSLNSEANLIKHEIEIDKNNFSLYEHNKNIYTGLLSALKNAHAFFSKDGSLAI